MDPIKHPDTVRHSVVDFRQMSVFVRDPLIFDHAEGVHIWDVDGKHYLDGLSGVFVAALGHRYPRIIAAIHEQLEKLTFAAPLHGTNRPAVAFCEYLASLTPGDLNTVKLASSGSEATETAMKVARQFWKQSGHPTKFKVISRYYGYHGATLGGMAASGTPKRRVPFEPLPAGFVHIPTCHCYRCPYQKSYPECGVFCAEYLRQVIALEGPETVSAVIVEPIGNTGGILVPPPEYLPKLRQICDEFNVLLIFDEMITGMGRTGQLFGAQTFGVIPDIMCLGKGISSGYAPLAATVWNERVAQAFWGPEEANLEFGHGHTFAGNPLSAAVGMAVTHEIVEQELPARARELGAYLEARLRAFGEQCGIFGEVRGKGLLWGIELVRDGVTREAFPESTAIGVRIGKRALERGLITRYDPQWIAFAPPLVTTKTELDEMLAIFESSVSDVLAEI
ncbi:MAG: aspartate aminotransferase family protein [Chloroflexi bacterium]|nr:aspartate aminotransferase family protein [Chloroflexota bacterium]